MIALHVLKCTPCQGQLNKKVYFIKKLSYMIVSRRNDTKPLVKISGFVFKMIMYIFNDSKKFKLVCVKYDNCIEFKVNRNGNVIEGILSKGVYYNWIAFPSLNTSCQLADFSDSFWNEEQLFNVFHNDFDVSTVLMTISELKDLFSQDYQSYTDGYKFMSTREYIFWLENQCEVLSYQMIEMQTRFESQLNIDLEEELLDERNQYHDMMRFQYDDTIFE